MKKCKMLNSVPSTNVQLQLFWKDIFMNPEVLLDDLMGFIQLLGKCLGEELVTVALHNSSYDKIHLFVPMT